MPGCAEPANGREGWNAISEKEFQQTVLGLANVCGWLAYHVFDSRRSQAGFPDLVMLRAGRLVVAELKSEKGKPTPEQEQWLDAFEATGFAEVKLWRPSMWRDVEETLA